ncbi:MAG TPA: FtsX-like permease family protein [Kofleriaceae bacterium]|nr:FtsX-like permease family protein [Kofleriaceae bacterium]
MHPILSALLRSKTAAILVAAQVALTVAIVCNALFVVQARLATANRPSGVDEDNVFELMFGGAGEIDDRAGMVARDLEILRGIPGVKHAAAVNSFPISTSGWGMGLTVEPKDPTRTVGTAAYFSGESYIDALGLKLVEGRDFEPREVRSIDSRTGELESDVVILSRYLAKVLFPEGGALGKTVYMGGGEEAQPMRVVGIVDTLMSSDGRASIDAYKSYIIPVRYLGNIGHYAVRTEPGERSRVMKQAEEKLSALRNDRVMIQSRTMTEIRDRRYKNERAGAGILVAVTIGLLLVTASGIVGIASLWVNQRRKQIGVRRALGARRRDILRYFVAENIVITTTGIAAGVALAIGLNQYLVSKVELARLPVPYLVGAMLAVWALGVIAVLGPAWRAASVPPAIATRSA